MDKQLKTVWQFIKANPVTMACLAVAVIITVSTIAYSRSHSTSLQRKQVESEAKLAQAIDNSKKVKSEREKAEEEAKKKAEEAKAAEELKLLEEKKAAEEAAAAAQIAKKQKAAQASQQAASGTISLTASAAVPKEGTEYFKIPVSWSAGFNSEKGYKLVWSTAPNPTYPGSNPEYHEGGTGGSGYIKVTAGTYYIRVCHYLGDGTCGTYSNQVTVVVP